MAEKGTGMPEDAGDFQGEAASRDPEADKLIEQHRKENERKAKAAERKSNVSDDLYKRHKKLLKSKKKELDKAQEIVSSINGELRELYATAKDDGLDIKALKDVLKMEAEDPNELAERFGNVARIIRATDSPLVQLGLFAEAAEEADQAPYAIGFDMGMNGESHDHLGDRYKTGTEEFEQASKGWHEGQAKLAAGMFRGGKGAAGKGGKGKKKDGDKVH